MKKFSIALTSVLLIIFGGILVFDTSIKYEYGKEKNNKYSNSLELIAMYDNKDTREELNENITNIIVDNSKEQTKRKTSKKTVKKNSKTAVKKTKKNLTNKKTTVNTKKNVKRTVKVDYSLSSLQAYARDLVIHRYEWTEADFISLVNLWNRESGWNPNSHNSRTGAHGIPQALPGNKMSSEGSDWRTNGQTQIRWGLKYIAGRYGSPSKAWEHFLKKHWY